MYAFSNSKKCFRKNPEARTTLLQLFSVFLFILFVVSCKKGDTGPAGATGAAGAAGSAGAAGANGATGPAGDTGTANVIYSAWFTPPSYKKDTVFGIYGFSYTQAITALTQPIVDSGVVLVFGKLDGYTSVIWPTAQVQMLPISITYMDGATSNTDTWSASITAGNLKIRLVSSLNAYGGISNAHQFRYILIPGGVMTTGSLTPGLKTGKGNVINDSQAASIKEVTQNYSQMSYAEICRRLGLPQ